MRRKWHGLVAAALCATGPLSMMFAQQKAGMAASPAAEAAPPEIRSAACRPENHAAGDLTGTVKDQMGALMAAVKIEVRDRTLGSLRTGVTDERGRFAFEGVSAGRYDVTAMAAGFEAAAIRDVPVEACHATMLHLVLQVASTKTEITVTEGAMGGSGEALAALTPQTSDTASLFGDTPGVSLAANGGVSSLPAIHGMADDRVKILVDGMTLASHCSNHMNPALSYVDPGSVARIATIAGITPVSSGGDSIGGTLTVDSAAPEFAAPGERFVESGAITGFHRTNGVVSGGDLSVSAASRQWSASYNGTYVNAADYSGGGGTRVMSTLYQSRTYNGQAGARLADQTLVLKMGYQDIPAQAFVNAHMDMLKNEARYANLHYSARPGWGRLEAVAFYERTGHLMNLLADKKLVMNMNMPMETKGANLGYSLGIEIPLRGRDTLRAGTEFHRFTLDDWWPASMAMVGPMGPNPLWNVQDGRRNRWGTYLEWEGRHGAGWTELLGVRSDIVRMNTGHVQGYNMVPTQTGSAAYYADATAFNSVRHGRQDNNVDVTALGRYQRDAAHSFEFGYARKTRSPNLYERYLWVKQSAMSVDMNGWFGDLNGYTGNLDLRPEIANTVSASGSLQDEGQARWQLKVTPYLTYVQDFIDVSRCPPSENGLGNGCTQARFDATTATLAATPYVTLQFGNYGARIVGVDGQARIALGGATRAGAFSLAGTLSYLHGSNTAPEAPGSPGQQPLYHMMPLHGTLTLEHALGNWSNAFALQAVDARRDLQGVRLELRSPGYMLASLRTSYQRRIADPLGLRFDAGIDNLAGRDYILPLGGRYYGPTMAAIKAGAQVPGMGRSFYGGLTAQF